MNKKITDKINQIREMLKLDGGDMEVVKYDEKLNILQIKLLGMCQRCPMAEMTVKGFIEKELQKVVSGIVVENV